ncbi:MAG: hypothetical protein HWN65_13935 [Candidatus Helarchaeota archaeon]|nr:hypothetical protein [Candidatus Helarchaeota archaeon]
MSDISDAPEKLQEPPQKIREPPQKLRSGQKSTMSKVKDSTIDFSKKIKNFAIEKAGERGVLTILIIIGLIVFAIGLIALTASNIDYQNLSMMNTLGLIGGTEYSYRRCLIYIEMYNRRIVGQIGAMITAVFLLIAAIFPFSKNGTPLFSEYMRLGMIAFAAVMIFVTTQI